MLPYGARQQVLHLIDDHQTRWILVKQPERQDFEIRTTACVRRLVPDPVNDLGYSLPSLGLDGICKRRTFRAWTSPNWLQMFGWSRTNLSTIIVLPMSLSLSLSP